MEIGKYISFFTEGEIKETVDRDFSDEKFEKQYASNPNRMSSAQIAMCGYDIVKNGLLKSYLEKKFKVKRTSELIASLEVIMQTKKLIGQFFKDKFAITITEGECDKKLIFPKITINGEIVIVPTLSSKDYFDVSVKGENAFSFRCNDEELIDYLKRYEKEGVNADGVSKVWRYCENQYQIIFGKSSLEGYDVELFTLYHTLAKDMNEKLRTDFPYSEDVIKKMWKYRIYGSDKCLGKYYISKSWRNNFYVLKSSYFYHVNDPKNSLIACQTGYGDEWSKEDLIKLLNALKPYAMSNYFAVQSKIALDKKYDEYDRLGVGYTKRPDYFKDIEVA